MTQRIFFPFQKKLCGVQWARLFSGHPREQEIHQVREIFYKKLKQNWYVHLFWFEESFFFKKKRNTEIVLFYFLFLV